jgi:hypothetical protein
MVKTIDITNLIFPSKELTSEEQRVEDKKQELYSLASDEASKLIEGLSLFEGPLFKLDYTRKVYKVYLENEGLKYDEERGL